jgi:hypothetical protein
VIGFHSQLKDFVLMVLRFFILLVFRFRRIFSGFATNSQQMFVGRSGEVLCGGGFARVGIFAHFGLHLQRFESLTKTFFVFFFFLVFLPSLFFV